MKRMVYMVISVAGLILAVLISVGCSHNTDNDEQLQINGISLSQYHMNYGENYSFFIRKEDDKVVFDAEVRFYDEPYEIILEGCQVDEKYYDELISLEKEYGISDYVNSYKKKTLPFEALDKTENITTVYYMDGSDKSADSGEYKDALYEYFVHIAKIYKGLSVTDKTN